MKLRQPLLEQYAPVVLFEHRSQYMRAQFVQTTHGGSSESSDTQCPSMSSWGSFPASFDWRRCVNSAVENGQPSPSCPLHYSSSPAASHPLRSTRWSFAPKTIRGRSRRRLQESRAGPVSRRGVGPRPGPEAAALKSPRGERSKSGHFAAKRTDDPAEGPKQRVCSGPSGWPVHATPRD